MYPMKSLSPVLKSSNKRFKMKQVRIFTISIGNISKIKERDGTMVPAMY